MIRFILLHAGLFSDVLNYVLHMSKSSAISQMAVSEEGSDGVRKKATTRKRKSAVSQSEGEESTDIGTVCVECFKFLKALAKDYIDVKERYDSCL